MLTRNTIRLLRIPFSFFLSPLYFFALSQVHEINITNSICVFFILHLLIYPASNGYNSYMDRDTASIGGLEKPPPPSQSLFQLTILMDVAACLLGLFISPVFACSLLIYIAASKAYSYRGIRLKKFPVISYLTVIIFQGAFTFALVFYGCSNSSTQPIPYLGILVSAFLIGGFYPLTQIYQHQQDLDDGVETISYKLGYTGTFIFCSVIYIAAFICMAQLFILKKELVKFYAVGIFFIPIVVYFLKWFLMVLKNKESANFNNTMRMNWIASICTNLAFITLLIWNHIE